MYKDFHYVIYVTLTLAIVIIFPIPVFLRLIFSVFPFYLYFTFIGFMEVEGLFWRNGAFKGRRVLFPSFRGGNLLEFLKRGADRAGGASSSRLVRTFSLVILVLFVFRTSTDAVANMRNGRVRKNGPYTAGSQELFAFLKNHTPPRRPNSCSIPPGR